MNTIDPKINTLTLNNHSRKIKKSIPKEQVDNFAKLIKLGLASNNSVSEHGVWQFYNGILNNKEKLNHDDFLKHIRNTDLSKGQLFAISLTVNYTIKAVKAYTDRIKEAKNYGLIEDPNGLIEEPKGPTYTKSL